MADEKPEKEGQATVRNQTPLYVRLADRAGGTTTLILLILLLIASLVLAWRFGNLKTALIILIVISFIYLIIRGFQLSAKENDRAALFIALALIVWGIDLVPATIFGISIPLGAPYAGFKFDFSGILNTNWASVLTSSLVLVFLIFGMVRDLSKKRLWGIIFGVSLILLINEIIKYYYTSNIQKPLLNYLFLVLIILIFILSFIFRDKIRIDYADWPTYLLMVLVFSFFWVNIGWKSNIKAVIHMIYILCFGFAFVRSQEEENPAFWHLSIPALILIDFYGYGLIWNYGYDFLKFIPPFLLVVVGYSLDKSRTNYPMTVFLFILFIVLGFAWPTYGIAAESIPFEAIKGEDYKSFFDQFTDRIREAIEGRLDIATAGLYRGAVEKNRYEDLGVYFSNIRAADPRFYTDDPITVWGTIRSKTYADAVIINFTCYRWKKNEKILADKIVPKTKFPIFTLEEVDTECTFLPKAEKDKKIQPGANTITFSAEYNFGTDAYLKTYFIDRDRFRASAREGFDTEDKLLQSYGVKDTKPTPVFTNGPVEIGMKAGPLIAVSEGYTIKPAIGITLTNRREIENKDKKVITRWEGRIKNITELVLLVPPGIEISNLDACNKPEDIEKYLECPCNMPFKKYESKDCQQTCEDTVLNPCTKACADTFKGKNEETNCVQECRVSLTRCKDECDFLFRGEENLKGSYTGYALDVGSLKFKDLNKDIDKHRSFECRIDPSTKVLDATPITTRYFRVRARYNYLLENSVQVNVESPPVGPLTAQEALFKDAIESIKSTKTSKIFDPDLIVAIATVESGSRHCCQEGYTKGGRCYRSDEKKCPESRIINSGTSIGIMQVRYYSQHKDLQKRIQEEVKQREQRVCESGETIFDFDCNVRVGVDILNNKRAFVPKTCKDTSIWKDKDEPETKKKYKTFLDACANGVSSTNVRYDSYEGIKAAIRGYNGWGRDDRYDEDYVEKVMNAYNKIKNGKVVDESGIKELLGSRKGSGMVYEDETP